MWFCFIAGTIPMLSFTWKGQRERTPKKILFPFCLRLEHGKIALIECRVNLGPVSICTAPEHHTSKAQSMSLSQVANGNEIAESSFIIFLAILKAFWMIFWIWLSAIMAWFQIFGRQEPISSKCSKDLVHAFLTLTRKTFCVAALPAQVTVTWDGQSGSFLNCKIAWEMWSNACFTKLDHLIAH